MSGDFELNASGNIKLSPLVGYSSAVAAGMSCLLRLEYVESEEALRLGQHSGLQLVLTPDQCRELAAALSRMADATASANQTGTRQ